MVRVIALLSLFLNGLMLFFSFRSTPGVSPLDVEVVRVAFFLLAFVLFLITRTFLYFVGIMRSRKPTFLRYLAPIFYLPSLFYPFLGYLMTLWARDRREYFLFLFIGLFFLFRFYAPLRRIERGEY